MLLSAVLLLPLLLTLLLAVAQASSTYPRVYDPHLLRSTRRPANVALFKRHLQSALDEHHLHKRGSSSSINSSLLSLESTFLPQLASLQGQIDLARCSAAALHLYDAPEESRVPHAYNIMFNASCEFKPVLDRLDVLLTSLGVAIRHTYDESMPGYRITYTPSTQYPTLPLQLLNCVPCLLFVERESVWTTAQVEDQPPWGLDRISSGKTGVSALQNRYPFSLTGNGTNVYVIDSGIQADHPQFTGRARLAFTVSQIPSSVSAQGGDCTGHGTHVAGIVAGVDVGVSKQANIHSVRIIGCTDTTNSDLIEAIQWVITNHVKPAVINISLGPKVDPGAQSYPRVPGIDTIITQAVNSGITVVVAAGNDAIDPCSGSPAGNQNAIVVGASTFSEGVDSRASFSNSGACVKMFAPGDDVVSSFLNSGYANLKGTSQASPHVTGVVAQLLQQNPKMTPSQVLARLQSDGQSGIVSDVGNSTNILLRTPTVGTELNSSPVYVTFTTAGQNAIHSLQRLQYKTFFGFSVSMLVVIVCASVGGLLILVGVCLCVRRRRRNNNRPPVRKLSKSSLSSSDSNDQIDEVAKLRRAPSNESVQQPHMFQAYTSPPLHARDQDKRRQQAAELEDYDSAVNTSYSSVPSPPLPKPNTPPQQYLQQQQQQQRQPLQQQQQQQQRQLALPPAPQPPQMAMVARPMPTAAVSTTPAFSFEPHAAAFGLAEPQWQQQQQQLPPPRQFQQSNRMSMVSARPARANRRSYSAGAADMPPLGSTSSPQLPNVPAHLRQPSNASAPPFPSALSMFSSSSPQMTAPPSAPPAPPPAPPVAPWLASYNASAPSATAPAPAAASISSPPPPFLPPLNFSSPSSASPSAAALYPPTAGSDSQPDPTAYYFS
ncbi:hypothetical protein RI367_006226 [Sorochytrium milnesiophthora]